MTSSIPAVNNVPLLDVRDLCVDFVNGSAVTHAVRGVSFQLGMRSWPLSASPVRVSPPLGARCCSCIRKRPASAPAGCSLPTSICSI